MDGRLTFLGTEHRWEFHGGVRLCGMHLDRPARRRLRPSALVHWNEAVPEGERERVVVIDTGPDFREQALRNGLTRVDAVFYTTRMPTIFWAGRSAAAQLQGLSRGGPIPLYASAATAATLERIFEYTFSARPLIRIGRGCGWRR